MKDEPTADHLRDRWREAQQKSMGQEMFAFAELMEHPDARWEDLLMGLTRPGIVGEDAWLQLRTKLKDIGPAGAIRRDSEFWRSALTSRQIHPESRCHSVTQSMVDQR